jgi:peptide/nickel transport system substrate-binding protein
MGPAKRSGHPKSLAVLVLAGVVLGSLALPAHGQSGDAHALRFGADLTAQSGISLDPTVSKGSNDFPWQNLIYDTLIHIAKDGSAQPGLATAWKIPDDHTIDLTLRKNVVFQDGARFDAAAVKKGLDRNRASNNPNFAPDFRTAFASVEVTGPLSVRLNLSQPISGEFFEFLAGRETMIVSPKAIDDGVNIDEHPVGAGAYQFVSFAREEKLTLRKFPKYWNARVYKLKEIDFVQTAGGPPTVSALRAGTIDAAGVNEQDVTGLTGGGIKLYERPSDATLYFFAMCTTSPPFDQLKVRQAIAYALDRKAMNQAAFNGHGIVSSLPWAKGSRFYDAKLDQQYAHNPAKSKRLLADAGMANGFSFDAATLSTPPFSTLGQVMQSQLADVGIKMNLVTISNPVQEVFVDHKAPTTLLVVIRPGVQKVVRLLSPDASANWCHYNNPKINATMDRLKAVGDTSTEAAGLWKEAERLINADVPVLYLAFTRLIVAASPQVKGVKQLYGFAQAINFEGVDVKR